MFPRSRFGLRSKGQLTSPALVMYFLLGAYTKRRASEILTKTERLSRTVSLSWQPDECGLSPGQVMAYVDLRRVDAVACGLPLNEEWMGLQ